MKRAVKLDNSAIVCSARESISSIGNHSRSSISLNLIPNTHKLVDREIRVNRLVILTRIPPHQKKAWNPRGSRGRAPNSNTPFIGRVRPCSNLAIPYKNPNYSRSLKAGVVVILRCVRFASSGFVNFVVGVYWCCQTGRRSRVNGFKATWLGMWR